MYLMKNESEKFELFEVIKFKVVYLNYEIVFRYHNEITRLNT